MIILFCLIMNIWNVYLQGSECVCIKSVGRTSWPASADPSNCNFQCQNTGNIYKNECGGNSSYNVFEFISGISTQIIYFLFDMHFFQWISKISYEATVGATLITLIILFIICLFISLVFLLIYYLFNEIIIHFLLGHLSHSCDVLVWVGVRRRASSVVCHALTSSPQ